MRKTLGGVCLLVTLGSALAGITEAPGEKAPGPRNAPESVAAGHDVPHGIAVAAHPYCDPGGVSSA